MTRRIRSAPILHGNRGMALESMVKGANNMYEGQGRALVNKMPTPWTVIGYNPVRQSATKVFPARSTVDWVGTYRHPRTGAGISIAFETKQVEGARLKIDENAVPIHQLDHLDKVVEMGGIAFILAWSAETDGCWVVDPAWLRSERSKEARVVRKAGRLPEVQYKASVSSEDLDEHARVVPWIMGLPDYLDVIDKVVP